MGFLQSFSSVFGSIGDFALEFYNSSVIYIFMLIVVTCAIFCGVKLRKIKDKK